MELINFELIKTNCYSEKRLCRINDDRLMIIDANIWNVISLKRNTIYSFKDRNGIMIYI